MDYLEKLSSFLNKDIILVWEDGKKVKGKVIKIHEKQKAISVDYYIKHLDSDAGLMFTTSNIKKIEDNKVFLKGEAE